MKYFVYDNEREGTIYHEFYKGRWDEKTFWHPDSICIHDNVFYEHPEFVNALRAVIPDYSPFGEFEICKEQWEFIGKQIIDPISRELYDEAPKWPNTVWPEYDCFTIIDI